MVVVGLELTNGVWNNRAILKVEAVDLLKVTSIRAVDGLELGDEGERLRGIDGLAGSVEFLVAHAEAIEITAVLVAHSGVAVVAVAAVHTVASDLAGPLADMRGVRRGVKVGLPDVHLGAAATVLAAAGVGVVVGAVPALDVGLSVDELDVEGALAVAVAGAVLGAGSVRLELGQATILVHLREVDGAVEAAGQLADIDVEGELLVEEVEEAVLVIAGHEVDARPDVGTVVVLGHELQLQGAVRRSRDAVCLFIVGTIDSAVGGASLAVGTRRLVPLVAVVAVGVAICYVGPAPVRLSKVLIV